MGGTMPHLPAPHMTVVAKTAAVPKWPPAVEGVDAPEVPVKVIATPVEPDHSEGPSLKLMRRVIRCHPPSHGACSIWASKAKTKMIQVLVQEGPCPSNSTALQNPREAQSSMSPPQCGAGIRQGSCQALHLCRVKR